MLIQTDRKDVAMGGMVATRQFSMKAGAHLMSILSGLYENPVDAMVREYLTNMYDACLPILKSGGSVKAPILRLPSKMNPTLEFQDFGIGMDFDTVWQVYAEYGNSTKSDTNDAVGGFGLGSKTAFCYNNGAPWNIVATKNGITNRFMAFIGEDGTPTLTQISSSQTNEPNGVTVSVPIRISDVDEVHTAANKYIPFFPIELTVENMDEVPAPIAYKLRGTDWGIVDANKSGSDVTVVMGNVPYGVSIRSLFGFGYYGGDIATELRFGMNNPIVLFVPIGSVDVTPSRDSLKVSDRTKATVQSALKAALVELPSLIDAKLAGAVTKWEKVELRHVLLDELNLPDDVLEKFDKDGIGSSLKVSVPVDAEVTQFSITDTGRASPTVTEKVSEFTFKVGSHRNVDVSVVIVNDTKKRISGMCREYVRTNFVNKGYSGRVANYGHTLCNVFSLTLPSGMGVDTFTQSLEGFTNVLLASDLVGEYTPVRANSPAAKGSVYTEYNGRFTQRVSMPSGANEYHYVVLSKANPKARYSYSNPKGELVNLRTTAKEFGVLKANDVVYGVRDCDVAELPSEWVNVEEALADAMIDRLTVNSAMVGTTVEVKNESRINFLRAVGNTLPEGKALVAEYDAATETVDNSWTVIGRPLRDMEWALRKPQFDRVTQYVADLKAKNTNVTPKDFDAESKRIIAETPMVQMMYDVFATPPYQIDKAVPNILKKYLGTT